MRVLGIDPGSRITGYGLIDCDAHRVQHLCSGCVRTVGGDIGPRLRTIFREIETLIDTWSPAEVAVERVFMSRNADSALKLGQARGAAISAAACRDLAVFEYAPNQIKKTVSGRGHADKQQVQFMIRLLLGLDESPPVDAADALAAAICHSRLRELPAMFAERARA